MADTNTDDEQLKQRVLTVLGMTDASQEEQDATLYYLEDIANKRFALALPEILNVEQLHEIDAMREQGKTGEEIAGWIQDQLPQYEQLIRAMIEDVADEVAANMAQQSQQGQQGEPPVDVPEDAGMES